MAKYIIEHLETKLGKWCLYEYEHISNIVNKKNLLFTNVKNKSEREKLRKIGKLYKDSINKLNFKKICVLDPDSPTLLKTKDKEKFEYFVFGGILGDYPPKKRTKEELTSKFLKKIPTRNIGKKQMSTDNAVYTVKKILEGNKFKELPFKYKIELKFNEFESIILPYQYNLINKKPLISNKVINYLKRKKGF